MEKPILTANCVLYFLCALWCCGSALASSFDQTLIPSPGISQPPLLIAPRNEENNPTLPQTLKPTLTNSVDAEHSSLDLWDRVRAGFSIESFPDDPLIYKHILTYSTHPDFVNRTLERSRLYLYFIVDEVERRGMPTEIALLPIVESAFNPRALSTSKASGLWQFVPGTGKLFGLNQDWWYDGRRNIVFATYSALDYLQRLHDEFGSWELALAAYNCGEGKLRHAIAYNQAHHQPIDYQHLILPDQTRNYIPKLLATKEIILAPEKYGLSIPFILDRPYFAEVNTNKVLDTKIAAQFAQMDEANFLMLNPGFNRPIISLKNTDEETILVPVQATKHFMQSLDDPQAKLVTWTTHHLKKGESFDVVANTYGINTSELKKVNGISPQKKTASGGIILVPDPDITGKNPTLENGKPESDYALSTKKVTHHKQPIKKNYSGQKHHKKQVYSSSE